MLISKNDKLYIACAGAGKTTKIVNDALEIKDKKILITTFTNENEENIKKKFYEINNGCIPENIKIQSWYEFLLRECFKPYLKTFFNENIRITGFTLVSGISGQYIPSDGIDHYMSKNNRVYSDKLSKLMFKNTSVKKSVMNRLSKIYNVMFIDEVQDMASWDLELIKEIHNSSIELIMVGDMLQRTYTTTKERQNKKMGKQLNIKEYIIDKAKNCDSIFIDPDTLKYTHRCSPKVCAYVNQKFDIDIEVCKCCDRKSTEDCDVFFINKEEVESKLKVLSTMQILYDKNSKYNKSYPAINIGKSKGLDFDNVVIYASKTMLRFLNNGDTLAEFSKSKLYVALTRARKNVYIVNN